MNINGTSNGTIRVAALVVRYYPLIGGTETVLASMIASLRNNGVETVVVTRRYPGLGAYEEVEGVPVYRMAMPGPKAVASFAWTAASVKLIARLRPHIVHAYSLWSPATAALGAKLVSGLPIVVSPQRGGHLGDIDMLRRKPLGNARLRLLCTHVDMFTMISRQLDGELAQEGVPGDKRIALPNSVCTDRYSPVDSSRKQALRRELELHSHKEVVLYTGRLSHEKRVKHLLAVWPTIRRQHPSALLAILGLGPEEASLKAMAGEGVRFLGERRDVERYLQAADIHVLPSITEGLSMAILEAQGAGLACIATRVGGAEDCIDDGVHGLLIPPDDTHALTDALLRLLGDQGLRRRLGTAARKRIVEQFSAALLASRLKGIYERVLAGHGATTGRTAS